MSHLFGHSAPNGQSDAYNNARAHDAADVIRAIEARGCKVHAIEADLSRAETPARLFNETEEALGPVSVLVHNASGWQQDSFAPARPDVVGRTSTMVNEQSMNSQLHVDARAGALLIAEFVTRHRIRDASWGRIVTLTSGDERAFPGEVSYGAAKAALISYTLSAASEMADNGITANVLYPP